nr:hypothetical protein MACL_00002453 [Theileria orientalis]
MADKNKTAANDGEPAAPKTSRPTLFNLLEVLASYSMTTPSQRQCIRDIVTEFLANKFEHSKVYSYIGAVVGHDRLHAVIKQLEADPDRSPLPDQDGLMKIESAFNLTRNYKTPNSTNGESTANKDEILRSIRRNLSKKCELTRSSSMRTASAGVLLQKACWLPIRRSLTTGPLYGHSLTCIGIRAYILGGSNGRNQGFNLSRAHVVNLMDFSSKQIMLSGEVPTHREGNSCNVTVLHQTHAIVLFGGFNGEVFFNEVYLLDLEKRRWSKRNPSGPLPTPRNEHSALIYPPRFDLRNGNPGSSEGQNKDSTNGAPTTPVYNTVVYLFVFGGKTGTRHQFQCLNDMWAYNVSKDYWISVETGDNKPCPRFGVSPLWADDETICVFGGESSSPSGYVDRTERVLLDDLWMFHITNFDAAREESGENHENSTSESKRNEKIAGMWLQDYYEGNIGPRSHYSSIFIAQRCKEMNTGAPRTIERLMFLTGGLTYSQGNKKMVIASDKLYFYFFSQKRWYSLKPNYPRNYIGEPFEPRQMHVACFFEKKNILFPGTKPSVPCIFFHGGFHKKQILSDSWVLSLTGEDLFFKNSLLSPETSSGTNKMDLRMYPPWYYRESHSPSLLWGMCTVQKWVFGALAHLVDNSLKEGVSSSNVSIKFEMSPNGEELMLSVQDDGSGLDYNTMNRLLKLFGRSYNTYTTNEELEAGCNKEEYGLGFKMSYGRLGNSVTVMSRTHDSIGIGMLSLELMCQCESREMAAPMCMWKLPSKELINRDGPCYLDQRHHQRLLMSYSPFSTAALLAEQINVLGTNPGTRFLFWRLRDDLDTLVLEDGTLMSSSPNHSTAFHLSLQDPGLTPNMLNGDARLNGDLAKSARESSAREGADKHAGCTHAPSDPCTKEEQTGEHMVKTEKAEDEASEKEKIKFRKLMGYQGGWYDQFPLWKDPKHSMDYCLPVYLYWLHLHSSCSYTVQDVLLKPNPIHGYSFEGKKSLQLDDGRTTITGSPLYDENNKRPRDSLASDSDEPLKKHHTLSSEEASRDTNSERQDNDSSTQGASQGFDSRSAPSLESHDLHNHVYRYAVNSGFGMDNYSCGKNACGYCGVSPIARSMSGGETLYSFLKAKLHKAVQLPFLFSPEDHAQGCFALIGFLNDPATSCPSSFDVTLTQSPASRGSVSPTGSSVVSGSLPAEASTPVTSSPSRSRKGKSSRSRSSSENRAATAAANIVASVPNLSSESLDALRNGSSESLSSNFSAAGRVAEAGVLLYYKGRLIRRLEGCFPAALDDLESATLPPKPSLFKGHLYSFALTAVISVPSWLVPSISKQEFVHENNVVFLHFKSKLIRLLSEYCKVCLDDHNRQHWHSERMKQIVDYDLANQSSLNFFMANNRNEVEGLDDEVVPSWKTQETDSAPAQDAPEAPALVVAESAEAPKVEATNMAPNP